MNLIVQGLKWIIGPISQQKAFIIIIIFLKGKGKRKKEKEERYERKCMIWFNGSDFWTILITNAGISMR